MDNNHHHNQQQFHPQSITSKAPKLLTMLPNDDDDDAGGHRRMIMVESPTNTTSRGQHARTRPRSSSSALVPAAVSASRGNDIVLLYGNTNTSSSSSDDAVVLYDCEQRSIIASNLDLAGPSSKLKKCPLCNTPFSDADAASHPPGSHNGNNGRPFISDSYFSILDYMYRTQVATLGTGTISSNASSRSGTGAGAGAGTGDPSSSLSSDNPFLFSAQTSLHGVEEASNELRQLPSGMLVNGYYSRFFVERKRLGVGSFGTVYLCNHFIDSVFLGEFAVKLVPVGDSREWLRGMMKEVKALERLSTHPNIVSYKHSWLEMYRSNEFCPFVPYLFILMSYCNAGSLESLIWPATIASTSSSTPPISAAAIPDETIMPLFLDTLQGLQHLHHNYVLHRDLKPSNILLCKDPSAPCGLHAVLSDFGTAEIAGEPTENKRHSGFTGTVEYTAPEVLSDMSHEYSEQSDMWSLGIVLFAMCYSQVPYSDVDPKQCAAMIVNGEPTIPLPEVPARDRDLRDIIQALTVRDPYRRPRCDDLVYHPFVRQKVVEYRYSRSPDYNLRGPRPTTTTATTTTSSHQSAVPDEGTRNYCSDHEN